ncbi:MAG: hypothetical protein WC528_02695 [Patescibacteria group bacterium]
MPEESMIKCSVCKQMKPALGARIHPKWKHIKVCADCIGICVRCHGKVTIPNNYFCTHCWRDAKKSAFDIPVPKAGESVRDLEQPRMSPRSPVSGRRHIPRNPYCREEDV